MTKLMPKGGGAVMARRVEPPHALDFFPTAPWATRALLSIVLGESDWRLQTAWEPAAGEGHMAEVMREYFRDVYASDVHDYGRGNAVGTFIGDGPDRAAYLGGALNRYGRPRRPHWVIANPPFNAAMAFASRALAEASNGVALLVRSVWLEGEARYNELFRPLPPAIVAPFVERVPMHRGRWEPDGSTMTAYAWVVWRLPVDPGRATVIRWIPPGQCQALERPDDRRRFAARPEPMTLFPDAAV